MAKIIELIYTEERRGLGKTFDDPVRMVPQWWTKEGELLFEKDTVKDGSRITKEVG